MGAALGGVVIPRALLAALRPIQHTVGWALFGMVFALVLDRFFGYRYDWEFYRWGLSALGMGAFLGALSSTRAMEVVRALQKQRRSSSADAAAAEGAMSFLGSVLAHMAQWINPSPQAVAVLGVIGGALGALVPALLIRLWGGTDATDLLGSSWLIVVCAVLLGAAGGACGGWVAWSERHLRPSGAAPP
jgi:hypothetical protein